MTVDAEYDQHLRDTETIALFAELAQARAKLEDNTTTIIVLEGDLSRARDLLERCLPFSEDQDLFDDTRAFLAGKEQA